MIRVILFFALCASHAWSVQLHVGTHEIPKTNVVGKNQDRLVALKDFMGEGRDLFILCDGHGVRSTDDDGAKAAEFVTEQLPQKLRCSIEKSGISDVSIRAAVHDVAEEMSGFQICGTTLAGIFRHDDKMYLFGVGASRIVLGRTYEIEQPIAEHNCDNPLEAQRIRATTGCDPIINRACHVHRQKNELCLRTWECANKDSSNDSCRLIKMIPFKFAYRSGTIGMGIIRYTRSLGDKKFHALGITSDVQIVERTLTPDYEIALIASDGIFETTVPSPITNEEALELVRTKIATARAQGEGLDNAAQEAAQDLAKLGAVRVVDDDISVIVIIFEHDH